LVLRELTGIRAMPPARWASVANRWTPAISPISLRAAEFIAEAGSIERFPTPDRLAAAAGPAPRSSSRTRSATCNAPGGGNKTLKRVFFQSAFCSLSHPASKTFYRRKRAVRKTHRQAVLALARRRVDVLHATSAPSAKTKSPATTDSGEHEAAAERLGDEVGARADAELLAAELAQAAEPSSAPTAHARPFDAPSGGGNRARPAPPAVRLLKRTTCSRGYPGLDVFVRPPLR
jgi:hypothetical protein